MEKINERNKLRRNGANYSKVKNINNKIFYYLLNTQNSCIYMFVLVHFCILWGLCNMGRKVQLNRLGGGRGMGGGVVEGGIKALENFYKM